MFRLGRCMKWAYFEPFSCKSARIHFPSHTNLISKRDAFPEIIRSLNLVSVQSRLEKRMAIHIAASEAEWKKPGSYDEFTQRALEEGRIITEKANSQRTDSPAALARAKSRSEDNAGAHSTHKSGTSR